jgi:predicted SprT family Zn-dependent metalloprotease
VTISTVFKDSEEVLLDLVMHHEILHKHLKFSSKWGRSRYHSTEFRKLEKKFEDYEENEHKLKRYLARCKVKRWFWG